MAQHGAGVKSWDEKHTASVQAYALTPTNALVHWAMSLLVEKRANETAQKQ